MPRSLRRVCQRSPTESRQPQPHPVFVFCGEFHAAALGWFIEKATWLRASGSWGQVYPKVKTERQREPRHVLSAGRSPVRSKRAPA